MPDFVSRKLLVAACLALVGVKGTAGAQTTDDDSTDAQLRQCARIEDSAQRVACYDDLVKQVEPAPAAAPDVAAVPAGSPGAPAEAEGRAVGSANAAPAASVAPAAAAEAPDSETETTSPSSGETVGPPTAPGEIRATIVDSAKSGINHFVVRLDNGQVWEETDGSRRLGLPKEGSTVVIYEGRFGGHRMKIGNDNRIAWVRRLE